MKNITIKSITFFIVTLTWVTFACNKTKQHSKWLTGETWKVNEININGQPFDLLPTFSFEDCNIYDEICFGNLQIENNGMARFAWQVRDNGAIFELSDQTENVDKSNEESVSFSSSFSGIYNVNNATKKDMELQSENCVRYPGKTVIIKLTKQ